MIDAPSRATYVLPRCFSVGIAALLVMPIMAMAQTPVAPPQHDLVFEELPARWDEAVPLGNGVMGALIWAEGDWLRFSLDRADLWDKRPVEEFQRPEFTFEWMHERVMEGDIASVQELIDRPYDRDPAPTKIPAGRLDFDRSRLQGDVDVRLRLADALCIIHWSGGARLTAFVHAIEPVGWFHLAGEPDDLSPPHIDPPPFTGDVDDDTPVNSLSGHDLRRLEYAAPTLESGEHSQTYAQQGWGDFQFAIHVEWRRSPSGLQGVWSVASSEEGDDPAGLAKSRAQAALARGLDADYQTHRAWWSNYWRQSYITLPDDILEAQWYRELYKFGCVARRGAPPISLQAVWTADERRIPPWKGDYHHDLNTQLSYWPCYSANRLEEGLSFLDWLWEIKPNVERWTREFYDHEGLNVPGMSTIEGEPMGGWNQYSCSPTSAAWLAHHFYLHWRYSMDREFLAQRAYPWLREAARFLELHSVVEEDVRRLPLSSSPEIHDNRLQAWFHQTTNYDLALVRWLFAAAAEMAFELGRNDEAAHWRAVLRQWPDFALAEDDGRLLVAPGEALEGSHRHFSHLMAIHPLGLIDPVRGAEHARTVDASLRELERLGSDWWVGYSFAWQGNLYARNGEGDNAAGVLRLFAECFCSPNTFHLNGDQCGGHSNFRYRPFTLEGNFAFAAGVQEMLLQSHRGWIEVFPAIPSDWRDASFTRLRAEGAALVSARRQDGQTVEVRLISEAGGAVRLKNPFGDKEIHVEGMREAEVSFTPRWIQASMRPGETLTLRVVNREP